MADWAISSKHLVHEQNLLKMNFFTHIFQGFYLDFDLLFIVLFLRNHFGRLFHISMGGASFISGGGGGVPHKGAALVLWGGGEFKKNRKMRGGPAPSMPPHHHYGKPCVLILNFCFACCLQLCMFSACMFYFTNITNV